MVRASGLTVVPCARDCGALEVRTLPKSSLVDDSSHSVTLVVSEGVTPAFLMREPYHATSTWDRGDAMWRGVEILVTFTIDVTLTVSRLGKELDSDVHESLHSNELSGSNFYDLDREV